MNLNSVQEEVFSWILLRHRKNSFMNPTYIMRNYFSWSNLYFIIFTVNHKPFIGDPNVVNHFSRRHKRIHVQRPTYISAHIIIIISCIFQHKIYIQVCNTHTYIHAGIHQHISANIQSDGQKHARKMHVHLKQKRLPQSQGISHRGRPVVIPVDRCPCWLLRDLLNSFRSLNVLTFSKGRSLSRNSQQGHLSSGNGAGAGASTESNVNIFCNISSFVVVQLLDLVRCLWKITDVAT